MSPVPLTPEEIQRIYQTKSFVLNQLYRSLTVKEVSRHAALSRNKLQEGFIQLFGLPVAYYIHQSRMLLGYFLLAHTSKPIKEVAHLTGFRYSKNFMTSFRKFFNETPNAIRKKFNQNFMEQF
jgi:AraC-like DNA-binding protein